MVSVCPFTEDGRGSSGIGAGKSIGLTEGILLPAETVDSNRLLISIHNPSCVQESVVGKKRTLL